VPGGLGVAAPPTGCNLRQGELEKEKVKGEEEERERGGVRGGRGFSSLWL